MTKQKDRYILIKWFDCTYQHGEVVADCYDGLAELTSVGVYLGEGERHISIAMDICGDGYYRHIAHIPKVNVIKRRWIK